MFFINTKKTVFTKKIHKHSIKFKPGVGTPYNGLYRDATPEKGTFLGFRYGKGVPFQEKVCDKVTIFEI